MASKITELDAQTGSLLAVGDLVPTVDVSDNAMAASGTDKKITVEDLALGLDQLGTHSNKLWGTTGCLASSFPRWIIQDNLPQPTSGTIQVVGILLPKGLTINTISYFCGFTALGSGVNQWFGIFDSSRNKLALTNDDTNTAWAQWAKKTLTISGGFTTTYTGLHYLGCMVKATTVPTLSGLVVSSDNHPASQAPKLWGTSTASLTNPASCPSTIAAITYGKYAAYAEVA